MSFKNFVTRTVKMTTLTFQNTNLSVINQRNQTFLTASDLGKALEYADPVKAIVKIYDRNADEFTAEMTALVEMKTAGGIQKVRIFSLRGAHYELATYCTSTGRRKIYFRFNERRNIKSYSFVILARSDELVAWKID